MSDVSVDAEDLDAASGEGVVFDIIPSIAGLFSFSGRTALSGFLLVQLLQTTTFVTMGLTASRVFSSGLQDVITIATPLVHRHGNPGLVQLVEGFGGGDPIKIGFGVVLILAWLVIGLATSVRRLHDLDLSGWWAVGIGVIGLIPYVGFLANFTYLKLGSRLSNQFGEPPQPLRLWSRMGAVPQHVWRGETPLANMLLIYVFLLNFLFLDKACSLLTASFDVSAAGLLFVGALLLLNLVMAVGLWRSADLSDSHRAWRLFGKIVALLMVARVVYTMLLLIMSGGVDVG